MGIDIIASCRKLTNGILKERCLKRDNYICTKCGSRENIDVHHKRYRIPPRLSDLQTLCKSCHQQLDKQRILAPICKRCNSSQTYIRTRTKRRVCRICGYVEDLNVKKN